VKLHVNESHNSFLDLFLFAFLSSFCAVMFRVFSLRRSFATAAASNNVSSSSSYLAALASSSIPSMNPAKPLKKPTPIVKEDKRISITLRERAKRRFDRLNLKPEFLPRWYLALKEKERQAAEVAKTAPPKAPREAPAHQVNAKSRVILKHVLQSGPVTAGALYLQMKEQFVSRSVFDNVVRALCRQGMTHFKVNKATLAEARQPAAADSTSPDAAASGRRLEFLLHVRNANLARKFLGIESSAPVAAPVAAQQ
jgi:hypothetical protein